MAIWGRVSAILWKDILCELRSKDVLTSVFVFALLVMVVFNFAFPPGSQRYTWLAPGVLWVAFTFAGTLGFNRSFVLEKEQGCLEGLMLCPVERWAIYLGKMLASFMFMLVVEAVILPIFSVLFDLPLFLPRLYLVVLMATFGFAVAGTVFSAIAVHTKAREVMLPLLFLPIVVPVIIAAVKASGLVLDGAGWGELSSWLQIIAAFDVIFTAVAVMVFEHVIEE